MSSSFAELRYGLGSPYNGYPFERYGLRPPAQLVPRPLAVANRLYNADGGFSTLASTNICMNVRLKVVALQDAAIYGLRFSNVSGGTNADGEIVGEVACANAIAVRGSIIDPDGNLYLLYFDQAGDREVTLPADVETYADGLIQGGGMFYVQAGDTFYVSGKVLVSAGTDDYPRYDRYSYWTGNDGGGDLLSITTTDQSYCDLSSADWLTAVPSADDAPGNGNRGQGIFGPAMILAAPLGDTKPCFEIWGDSRCEDWPLSKPPAGVSVSSSYGQIGRALTALSLPYFKCHRGSERAYQGVQDQADAKFRSAMAQAARVSIYEHGQNDYANGRTLAQMVEALYDFTTRRRSEGKTVIACTVYPYTTSTDGWLTTANQTIVNAGHEVVRKAYNNFIRGLTTSVGSITRADCFDEYLELADQIESGTNSGTYKPGTQILSETATGGTNGTGPTIVQAAAGWTASAYRQFGVYVTAGTGAGQYGWIVDNTTDTLYVLPLSGGSTWAAATDATSEYLVVNSYTADGLHPTYRGRAAISDYVEDALRKYTE